MFVLYIQTTIVQELQKNNQFKPQRQKHDKNPANAMYNLFVSFSREKSFSHFQYLIHKVLLFEGLCHSYWMLLWCLCTICWSVDIAVVALVIVLSIRADLILDFFARILEWCFQ